MPLTCSAESWNIYRSKENEHGEKEPYDMTNNYARMERDKRKAIGNPNKNIHHKKNGSNYQKDTGSMVRSTSTRRSRRRCPPP